MFKTMWNMPAKLLRLNDESDVPGDGTTIASGSLEEMVEAADELGADEAQRVIITCVGRDRPISWAEIRDLRRVTGEPA